jgi:hypothetical protein
MRDRTGGRQACMEHGQDGRGTNPGVTHYPASAIGRCDLQDEGRIPTACRAFTISPAAHTTPYRLSAVSGEKMNKINEYDVRRPRCGIADLKPKISDLGTKSKMRNSKSEDREFKITNSPSNFESRKSPMSNRQSKIDHSQGLNDPMTQSPDDPIVHPLWARESRGPTKQVRATRAVYPSTDGPNGGVKPRLHQLVPLHQAPVGWGYSGSVYNGRLDWLIRNKGISS